jgi:hypothetical protein
MPAQQSGAQALLYQRNLIGKTTDEQATSLAEATSVVLHELADQGSVDWTTLVVSIGTGSPGTLLVDAQAVVMLGASLGTR